MANTASPVTVDTNGNANVTWATALGLGITGGLTKAGTGTLSLSSNTGNTYTGATTVNAGALALTGAGMTPLANTAITVKSTRGAGLPAGCRRRRYAFGTGSATLSLNSGSTFSMVDGAVETLTIAQATLSGASLDFDLGNSGSDESGDHRHLHR